MVIEYVATGFPDFQHSNNDKYITSGGSITQSLLGKYLGDGTYPYDRYTCNIAMSVQINGISLLFAIINNQEWQ